MLCTPSMLVIKNTTRSAVHDDDSVETVGHLLTSPIIQLLVKIRGALPGWSTDEK